MPKRFRSFAGTMMAPRFPTLADSIGISLRSVNQIIHYA
jgi:hypothetical protein